MHGLILKAKTDEVDVTKIPGGEQVTGVIHAGDFGGHWLSKTDLVITITLTADAVDASIVAHNVGAEAEPMAIGWHPYFNLPSGDRTQARMLHSRLATWPRWITTTTSSPPASSCPWREPTTTCAPPAACRSARSSTTTTGATSTWKDGAVTVKVIDPAAHYGVKIEGLSPEIKAIQIYAPPTASFVAIEHQYNFADPFGKEWGKMDTGMVTLKPGQSTKWHVRLKVFVP